MKTHDELRTMIIYRRTSLLESSAQTLVNTVNCVGVMGKGIAKAFKDRHPDMFETYKRICDQKLLEPGKLWLWRGPSNWVLNFPTKVHWRHPSKLEWIELGLKKFVDFYASQGITDISFPRLGCGNGGLDWEDVRPLMDHYLSKVDIPVYIHDHTVDIGIPEHMEALAAELARSGKRSTSFADFLHNIKLAAKFSHGPFLDIDKVNVFSIGLNANTLSIETTDSTWLFDEDDLRGVWMKLHAGYVTEKDAGWSARGGGKALLSVMSVLPELRPLQIQRGDSSPEVAVEFRPEARELVETGGQSQLEISWR